MSTLKYKADTSLQENGDEIQLTSDVFRQTRVDLETVGDEGRHIAVRSGDPTELLSANGRTARYSKNTLLAVYLDLQRRSRLQVPSGAQIPITFQKEGPRIGLQEFHCSTWIWIGAGGAPYTALTHEEIQERLQMGIIQPNDYLLPMSIVKQHGIRGRDFCEVYKEKESVQHLQQRQILESKDVVRYSPLRTWIGTNWLELCKLLDCEEVCYLDSSNRLQGPFGRKQILQWWKHGYFPEQLQVRPSHSRRFVDVEVLLANWFSREGLWHGSATSHAACTQEFLIRQFLHGKLNSHDQISPSVWHGTRRTLPALYLIVHWLPFSEIWLVKEESSKVTSMSISEAFDLWMYQYRTQNNTLVAKPSSWRGNDYTAIEHLMASYSFIK